MQADPERGGTSAEFVLNLILAISVFLAITQILFALHVRAVVSDCLREGAQRAALANSDIASGISYTKALLGASLAPGYRDAIEVSISPEIVDGMEVLHARANAPLPLVGLIGPGGTMRLEAFAVSEAQFVGAP